MSLGLSLRVIDSRTGTHDRRARSTSFERRLITRIFDDFGVGRPRVREPGRGLGFMSREDMWNPELEVFHRDSELVIRVDLPGLTKDDVKVDVNENQVTIEGERHVSTRRSGEGVYRSERSYGRFYRVIPLPEGVIADQAKATFKNGVLEITMPAPPERRDAAVVSRSVKEHLAAATANRVQRDARRTRRALACRAF